MFAIINTNLKVTFCPDLQVSSMAVDTLKVKTNFLFLMDGMHYVNKCFDIKEQRKYENSSEGFLATG